MHHPWETSLSVGGGDALGKKEEYRPRTRLLFRLSDLRRWAGAPPCKAPEVQLESGAGAQIMETLSGTGQVGRAAWSRLATLLSPSRVTSQRFTQRCYLPVGASRLVVRALGFPPVQVSVELAAGAITDRPIQLDSTDAGRLASAQA